MKKLLLAFAAIGLTSGSALAQVITAFPAERSGNAAAAQSGFDGVYKGVMNTALTSPSSRNCDWKNTPYQLQVVNSHIRMK
jgi:hypothetical protein